MRDLLALRAARRAGGLVLLFAGVLTAGGHAQQKSAWTIGVTKGPLPRAMLVATTAAETRASDPTVYELTLTCGPDHRRTSVTTQRAIAWQTSARDPRESYVAVEVSVDDRPSQRVVLLRERDGAVQLTTVMRVMRGEVETPGFDAILRSMAYGFDGKGLPVRRLVVYGLAPDPLEFRFDTLTDIDRERLRKACFGLDERRLAENACRKEARARAIQAFEAQVYEANREWCDSTRDARRQQLVDTFLRGVSAARNGGAGVAAAFAAFFAANPDVVLADGARGTQSCPDPHFFIDTTRLRPLLQRSAPGQTGSVDVAERRLTELLKEPGVVVSTAGLTFDPPQPKVDRLAWSKAISEAEAPCRIAKQ